jgi:hypothetical protein
MSTPYTPEQIRDHAHLLTSLAVSRSLDDTEKAGEMLLQLLHEREAPAEPGGIARRKRDGLIADGYTITGWLLSKPGERHALMHGAAVRWLSGDSLWALMHVEGSRVVPHPPAETVAPAEPIKCKSPSCSDSSVGYSYEEDGGATCDGCGKSLLWAAPVAPAEPSRFPERDPSMPAEQQGVFRKFVVQRVDGSDLPGGKHHGCAYFVLDMDHDAHAPAALRAYADACRGTQPPQAADQRARFPAPVAPAFDILAHLARQCEFSARTFGPGPRVEGVTDHIAKELIEVRESGGSLAEWVDVIILAFDGAWRSGATPQQIIDAMVAKQTKNEGRVWPDWRTAPAGKAIEHDRSIDA